MTLAALLGIALCAGAQDRVVVDAGVPGGNIVVEKVENDTVTVHQDLRDTEGYWFYWRFRVRGAQGRTLTFHFTKGKPIGVYGPAVSTDGGETWVWLGKEFGKGASFKYAFASGAKEVQFCFGIPYLEKNLKTFLRRHEGSPNLKIGTLCKSEKGREVEKLFLGRLDGKCRIKIFLTCRHHACEMTANYSLEGIMEEVLAGKDDGAWFRENAEFLIIPFMDKDGVEDGDQGKNRRGRDHNRDYAGESAYASVRAVRESVPQWSQGKLRFSLDMHCPGPYGQEHEVIHFVGSKEPENWERVVRLSEILESVQSGPPRYEVKDNLPYGKSWNNDKMRKPGQQSCAGWAQTVPGIHMATSIEIPYAVARGTVVTPDSARAFGKDLAKAIRQYLEKYCKE
jgi:hypothetical protein